ncbi:MAG: DUF4430 domain-containing protein [Oscillospiraceae bacterium]|nr:DUF4430 domain-containing protein [Oscillospiraceae bacterium]
MEKKKRFLFFLLSLLLLLLFCGCQNKNKTEVSDFTDIAEKTYDNAGKLVIPENYVAFAIYGKDKEVILDTVLVKYQKNMSAADISRDICREKNIPIAFSGVGNMVYVQGINNLFELDNGAGSGWLYSVNDVFQSIGCGDYTVKDRDCIEWFYTLDMGKDVGGDNLGATK